MSQVFGASRPLIYLSSKLLLYIFKDNEKKRIRQDLFEKKCEKTEAAYACRHCAMNGEKTDFYKKRRVFFENSRGADKRECALSIRIRPLSHLWRFL